MLRILAVLLTVFTAGNLLAETQPTKSHRVKNALNRSGMDWGRATYAFNFFANTFYYDTAVELLAATPTEGRVGYALDTNVAYMYVGSAWVALLSGSGILGTNGGTIGNETNNLWTFTENSEDLTMTFASNLVSLGSTTSATFVLTPATAFTADVTLNGGAGALVFGAVASSVVTTDNSATGLLLGSTGQLGLLTLDTTDNLEELNILGTTATSSFRVFLGFATFDEQAVFTLGADVNGDFLLGGGVGALTFDAASSSVVTTDNSATGLVLGALGALDILTVVTTDASPGIRVDGINGQTALHLDVGDLLVDEASTFTGDAAFNGGAGAVNMSGSGDSSVVLADDDATALVVGAAGALDIIGVDTTSGAEGLNVGGKLGVAAKVIAESGSTDTSLVITQTLNDTGAVDGSEDYTMIKGTVTVTDGDAWATTRLMDLITDATSMFRVTTQGGVESQGEPVAGGTYSITAVGAPNMAMIQYDGTVLDLTANVLNRIYYSKWNLNFTAIVQNASGTPDARPTGAVGSPPDGFNLGGTTGVLTDADHWEVWGGAHGAVGRPMVVGTDPAFQACWTVYIEDVSGSDATYCGWREATSVPGAVATYADFFAVGHISGAYQTIDEGGADASAPDAIADTETDIWCVMISAAGVATATVDGVAPTGAGTQTLSDGLVVVPFCNLLHDSDLAEDTVISNMTVSLTQP